MNEFFSKQNKIFKKNLKHSRINNDVNISINKIFFYVLTVIILLVFVVIADRHYIVNKQIKAGICRGAQKDLRYRLSEKTKLRKSINEAFSSVRLIRKHIKFCCNEDSIQNNRVTDESALREKNHQSAIFNLVNNFYQAKIVFGLDVGNVILDFVKLADNNQSICGNGSFEAELRKYQHKANVLMEDSILRDRDLLGQLRDNKL